MTLTPTATPKPSNSPRPTATPQDQFVTLGSPFAPDCGDGVPRVWSNDSPNGRWDRIVPDEHHGHVDLFVPDGCNADLYHREVIAPISGTLVQGDKSDVFFLRPDPKTYINEMEDVLRRGGIENPSVERIYDWYLNIGHLSLDMVGKRLERGEPFADVVYAYEHWKIAFQIVVFYEGNGELIPLAFSPTVFGHSNWPCVPGSRFDCVAVYQDYNR